MELTARIGDMEATEICRNLENKQHFEHGRINKTNKRPEG